MCVADSELPLPHRPPRDSMESLTEASASREALQAVETVTALKLAGKMANLGVESSTPSESSESDTQR